MVLVKTLEIDGCLWEAGYDEVDKIVVNCSIKSKGKAKAIISYKDSKLVKIINLDNVREYNILPMGRLEYE